MTDPVIVVKRNQWGARHSAGRSPMLPLRREINVHHTVTPATDDPCADMRKLEDVLNGRGLAPGYSFVFHPSGVILEGAGGMKGAHTAGRNSLSYGFSFLGNFDREQPTWAALAAAGWLIGVLRYTGALVPNLADIKVQGHRDTKATACPGANLYPRIDAIKWFAGAMS